MTFWKATYKISEPTTVLLVTTFGLPPCTPPPGGTSEAKQWVTLIQPPRSFLYHIIAEWYRYIHPPFISGLGMLETTDLI